jgi:nucleoside-diphosphate kinase
MTATTKERTLAIIKPGAFKSRHAGPIIADIQARGFNIVDMRMVRFTDDQAKAFYAEHAGRAYFQGLVDHQTSGPCVALILEGTVAKPNVIQGWRDVMGPTDPSLGTATAHLRAKYGYGMPGNALHGSDSAEAFAREVGVAFHWGAAQAVAAGLKQELEKLRKEDPAAFPPAGQTIAGTHFAALGLQQPAADTAAAETAQVTPVPGSSETAGG